MNRRMIQAFSVLAVVLLLGACAASLQGRQSTQVVSETKIDFLGNLGEGDYGVYRLMDVKPWGPMGSSSLCYIVVDSRGTQTSPAMVCKIAE